MKALLSDKEFDEYCEDMSMHKGELLVDKIARAKKEPCKEGKNDSERVKSARTHFE